MTSDPTPALTHLADVNALDKMSGQLRRQAVRDARSAGAHITEIALVLGIRNRNGLYAILDEKLPAAVEPAPTPVVFVRGAKVDAAIWRQATEALHARGWVVVRDRTQAWHLARGRVPVVLVDITHTQPRIGLVKARYSDTQQLELPAARPATLLDTLDLDQLALAIIDQLTAPTDQTPYDQKDFTPEPTTPAAKTGITTKRTMSLPRAVMEAGAASSRRRPRNLRVPVPLRRHPCTGQQSRTHQQGSVPTRRPTTHRPTHPPRPRPGHADVVHRPRPSRVGPRPSNRRRRRRNIPTRTTRSRPARTPRRLTGPATKSLSDVRRQIDGSLLDPHGTELMAKSSVRATASQKLGHKHRFGLGGGSERATAFSSTNTCSG